MLGNRQGSMSHTQKKTYALLSILVFSTFHLIQTNKAMDFDFLDLD